MELVRRGKARKHVADVGARKTMCGMRIANDAVREFAPWYPGSRAWVEHEFGFGLCSRCRHRLEAHFRCSTR